MSIIFELNQLCSSRSVTKFFKNTEGDSLIQSLYRLVHSGKYTEDEIAKKIYGKDATADHAKYKALRTRLRNIFLEAFMMQETRNPSYTTYEQAYQHGYQQLALLRVLAGKRAYKVARDIAVVVFKNVRNYEIIPLNQGLTDILASLHLGVAYNQKLFEYYSDLHRHYSQAAFDLNVISNYYREIRNSIYAQRESPSTTGQRAREYAGICAKIAKNYPAVSQLQGMYISMEMTGCILRGEYNEAIKVAEQGEKILMKCEGVSQTVLSILALERVDCAIRLNDFEMGKQQIASARLQIAKKSMHELKLVEYAIKLGLRTRNYEFAYREFVALDKSSIKRLLTPRHAEYWLILEAAINLLLTAGEIIPDESWPVLRKFRTKKFINDVPSFGREKRGVNIQILVIQALYFIIMKKYDDMVERTDALNAYCKRYLKNDENRRNDAFFKLLLIVIKANFNRAKAIEKGKYTFGKLRDTTDWSSLNNTEIIPYEDLWMILLSHLEEKPKRGRSKHHVQKSNRTIASVGRKPVGD
ncbi:hypothetical protein FUA23_04020 [Neolewinella aurantiaca]|uniref:Uncharacterized protein n=1 Tax=Neolewinella aurantiaca TaxID=2602767 RepID=A0A5C7G037_9BACT|nr:hypothetical protein [Neolewinella aurantiaca]TXF90976.1 hypothetical protein FUA23_04020 [Neolewinella aurantiaca]